MFVSASVLTICDFVEQHRIYLITCNESQRVHTHTQTVRSVFAMRSVGKNQEEEIITAKLLLSFKNAFKCCNPMQSSAVCTSIWCMLSLTEVRVQNRDEKC